MTPDERAHLRELAEAVIDAPPDPAPSRWPEWAWEACGDKWYPQRVYSVGTPYLIAECYEGGGGYGNLPPTMAPFIAAAHPGAVAELVERVDRAERWAPIKVEAGGLSGWIQPLELAPGCWVVASPELQLPQARSGEWLKNRKVLPASTFAWWTAAAAAVKEWEEGNE